MAVLREWRRLHQSPQQAVLMGVRSAVKTVTGHSPNGRTFSRLKREEQIVAKLCRDKGRLYTMVDIGGCRAVLNSVDEVRAVADRLRSRSTKTAIADDGRGDYITSPKSGGYRALHLHCTRDEMLIELQLRTQLQQQWAKWIETIDDAGDDYDLKHERGPDYLINLTRRVGDVFAQADAGQLELGTPFRDALRDAYYEGGLGSVWEETNG